MIIINKINYENMEGFYLTTDTKRIILKQDNTYYELLPGYEGNDIVVIGDFVATYMFPESAQYDKYETLSINELSRTISLVREELIALKRDVIYPMVEELFEGVVDKGGAPYIEHLKAVEDGVNDYPSKIVALLHDTVEDTTISTADLIPLVGVYLADAVDNLTKREGESNREYLNRVKSSYLSVNVKISDLRHNMDTSRLNRELTKVDYERLSKYQKSLMLLEEYKEDLI